MADITFFCPFCHQKLKAPPEMEGQTLPCPTCQKEIEVKAGHTSPSAEPDHARNRETIPPPTTAPKPSSNDGPFAKINTCIVKTIGLLDNHPWERWVSVANDFIGKWLPFIVAIAGIAAFLVGFISGVRAQLPFSAVIANLGILAGTFLAMHLTPKALALPRSFLEKREADPMRPELLYILKVNACFGALVAAGILILQFDGNAFLMALQILAIGALLTVVFGNPALIGIKATHPQNAIEEVLCIFLLPLKLALSLLTLVVGIGTVALFVWGIEKLFDRSSIGFESMPLFGSAVLAPVAIPLAVYLLYLVVMFFLDLYRAIVAIPRKLDEVRKALEDKH